MVTYTQLVTRRVALSNYTVLYIARIYIIYIAPLRAILFKF